VASLRLVSPGAATDGVTCFSPKKTDDLFLVIILYKVMTFLAVVSSPLPPSDVVYPLFPVFILNSARKNYFSRMSPLDGVIRGSRLPLVTPLETRRERK